MQLKVYQLGIVLNANIQIIPTQSSSPAKYLITIVDKNNVVTLFELDDEKKIKYNTSIIIHNDYTLSQY
jgi:hypothetical protein